jgi:hypothetical protein
MAGDTRDVRERLREGTPSRIDDGVLAALAAKTDQDATIVHQLASKKGLARLDDGGDSIGAADGGGSVLVATGRQLVFAVETPDGPVVGPIPFTEIKKVDYNDGMLRARFDVAVWGEGSYRFKPVDRSGLGDVAAYVRRMSDVWDTVVAALGDARQHVVELGNRLEAGDREAASDHRAEARRLIEDAREATTQAPTPRDALSARIDEIERELFHRAMTARIARAETLRERGASHERGRRYPDAHATLRTAVDHLEGAFQLAVEHDFDGVDEVRRELADIMERIESVEARPLAEAERAYERAAEVGAERGVVLLHEALEHYRTALTAGWGVDRADFDGDATELRECIETVVGELIEARIDLAETLVQEADERSFAADATAARDRYDAAAQQLSAAQSLATQYESGDADDLADRLAAVREREANLDRAPSAV